MSKEGRTIRNVPLSRDRNDGYEEDAVLYEHEERPREEAPASSVRRVILWGATFLFVALLGVAFLTSFTGATITVTPKTKLVQVDNEFIASKSADAKLRFDILPINETAEMVIPADVAKKRVEKAIGTLVIYNTFSDKPQRLIKNTRFQSPNGLVYRVGSSLTVPGKAVKSGKTIPGSVETAVTADAAGAEYNIPLSDFTVPGFKGDSARFAGFYARSKTPMTGGFDGMLNIPSESALQTARADLQKTLDERVAKAKQSVVPQGYVLFDGALTVRNESVPPEERKSGFATVTEKKTGVMYVFKKEDIAKAIASVTAPTASSMPVEIPEIGNLLFQLKETPSGNPADATTIRFTLKGGAHVTWIYDEKKLKDALIGKSRSDLASVLSAFPTIEKIDLVLRPFWTKSFSNNPDKLIIKKVVEEPASNGAKDVKP